MAAKTVSVFAPGTGAEFDISLSIGVNGIVGIENLKDTLLENERHENITIIVTAAKTGKHVFFMFHPAVFFVQILPNPIK